MSEVTNDESRLRATEAQMRRALGLQDSPSPRPEPIHSSTPSVVPHRPRHFVRDGEVPVTVIHRDHHPDGQPGTNQLDAARQTIRSLTAAREHSERLLAEAQATIQQLQTQLAHERLAKDEAAQRAKAEKHAHEQAIETAQAELIAERAARHEVERELADALQGGREPTGDRHGRLVQVVAQPRRRGRPRKNPIEATPPLDAPLFPVVEPITDKTLAVVLRTPASLEVVTGQDATQQPAQPRRRGRPPKVRMSESVVVEWWKPGWKKKCR